MTISLALVSLVMLSAVLWMRAAHLTSATSSGEMPVLQGSMQVAVNTDMSLALAILTTAFGIGVAVALWCGLLQRLLQVRRA